MKFQPPKGTKDYLPEEMIVRQKILETVRNTFESFGFQPLETSAIESWEVLSAKGAGGPEILKETFNFKDLGGRRVGLRYDLTVPLARVVASNSNLPLPFKRYQIEKVWRYGEVSKGRLREFLQADIDTIGSESVLADAEIIACTITSFVNLGFDKFIVRINNRKILNALTKYAGVESKSLDVLRVVDKLDKIGVKGVERELVELKISKSSIKKILNFIQLQGISECRKALGKGAEEGIVELEELIGYLRKMKVEPKFKIDFSLARGLDYYTGPIFEVFAEEGIGSIAGGGRYDKMIGVFSGRNLPATGISLGIERIIEVMKERKMVSQRKSKTKAFVVSVSDDVKDSVLEVVQNLRKNFIPTDFDIKGRQLKRQLEYANSLDIPFSVIVGKDEIKRGVVKVKDMKKGEEEEVENDKLVSFLKGD